MRRSAAPSKKLLQINPKPTLKTSNHSNIISEENLNENKNQKQCQILNVVWGKRSSKKHKTWEDDGILEVQTNCLFLKSLDGKILGTLNNFTKQDLYEGNIICIAGKEVLIQEVNKDEINRKKLKIDKSTDSVNSPKRKKQLGKFEPNLILTNVLPKSTKTPLQSTSNYVYDDKEKCNHVENSFDVSPSLAKHLRPHQREGVTFLLECISGKTNVDCNGAILADEMGLGKTLQCLTVCHTLLKHGSKESDCNIQRILIVTPSSLTDNWNKEIKKWLSGEKLFAYIVDGKHKLHQYTKQTYMPFVIVSYETLISNFDEFNRVNFDLLICDEGHRLKNNNIKASVNLRQLNIKRRIILTGTPVQNDLEEFFHLVDFVNPNYLGSYSKYKSYYEIPINLSQCPDADEEIKELGTERSEELNRLTNSFILRRTQSINNIYLPKKRLHIVFVRPSHLQQSLLKKVIEWYENHADSGSLNHLQIINVLKKICNHPSIIKNVQNKCDLIKYVEKFLPKTLDNQVSMSAKLELIEHFLIEVVENKKQKVVLVSNHTTNLDLLQKLCNNNDFKYLRLDGKTKVKIRNSIVSKFNNENNQDVNVFLLSTKAGGLGLNLTGASNLVLFDVDWNPANDLQAMSRIWRDGQKYDVNIYRLITCGTIEEKIFQRQIAKTSLGDSVMNPINDVNTMKFSKDELKDLFSITNDFDQCNTHESLQCTCSGNGRINSIEVNNPNIDYDDPYRIYVDNFPTKNASTTTVGNSSPEVNELMKWEHYKPPISNEFLMERSLADAVSNICFIFSNEMDSF